MTANVGKQLSWQTFTTPFKTLVAEFLSIYTPFSLPVSLRVFYLACFSSRVFVAEPSLLTRPLLFIIYCATNPKNDRWSAFYCTL